MAFCDFETIYPDSLSESRQEEDSIIQVLPAVVSTPSEDVSILFASNIAKNHQRDSADPDRPTHESAAVELEQDGAGADCLEGNTVTSTTVPGLSHRETLEEATTHSKAESVKESSPYSGLMSEYGKP